MNLLDFTLLYTTFAFFMTLFIWCFTKLQTGAFPKLEIGWLWSLTFLVFYAVGFSMTSHIMIRNKSCPPQLKEVDEPR